MRKYSLVLLFALTYISSIHAQFAPAAGQPGTTAMHKDSSAFIGWANACSVQRGWQNISNTGSGYASAGDSTLATGPAGTGGVVSLGDGGVAICRFTPSIRNGTGYDFAVFENSFTDHFLELALVEVSSDGINYFRFPATSLRQDTVQADAFDTLGKADELNNLAGKYRGNYGTPFDLEELNGISGLDVSNIGYVRIIDVIGTIDQVYATHDQYGHIINDPWPTEFPTGGFDLDAVGVINNQLNAVKDIQSINTLSVYPNPCSDILYFQGNRTPEAITLSDLNGRIVISILNNHSSTLDLGSLEKGIYFITLFSGGFPFSQKIVRN